MSQALCRQGGIKSRKIFMGLVVFGSQIMQIMTSLNTMSHCVRKQPRFHARVAQEAPDREALGESSWVECTSLGNGCCLT